MRQTFSFLLLMVISLTTIVTTSCNNSDTGFIETSNNSNLKCDSLFQYEEWTAKLKNGQIKTVEKVDEFKSIGATFKIKSTSLYLDSNNSILLHACVTLLKGAKNCEFSGYVHRDQYNEQTGDNVKTFSIASIQYLKKSGGGIQSETKEYTLFSQGSIEELKPTKGKTVNLK
jgi:hypothetical protein